MTQSTTTYKDQLSWGKLALFSFLLVSILGVLMRYKIAFSLPWVDQKNLQHAHSHFAFSGWVTLGLMLVMVHFLKHALSISISKYKKILIAQILISYGMLVSFTISGYGLASIFLSTTSIVVFVWFAILFYKDSSRSSSHHQCLKWYYASLALGIIATLGTFSLAYTKITNNTDLHTYLASLYYYLHFQYNGWFFFSIIGSLIYYLTYVKNIKVNDSQIFSGFILSIVPAYGLSVLWLDLPMYIYVFVVIAAIAQVFALFGLVKILWVNRLSIWTKWTEPIALTLIFGGVAMVIKFLLQLGSVVPELSELAFGFRPIVIAYLHLVLLAFTSVVLISLLIGFNFITIGKGFVKALSLLLIGIFLNELVLAVQGIASLDYVIIPYNNIALFIVAILIMSSLIWIWVTQFWNSKSIINEKSNFFT